MPSGNHHGMNPAQFSQATPSEWLANPPTQWSVSALCAGKVLATGEVDVKGTETFHTILRTGGGDGQK